MNENKKRIIAIDTETHPFKPFEMAPRIVCLSWADNTQSGVITDFERIEKFLFQHLTDCISENEILVGHSVAYDFAVILANFPDLWKFVWGAYAMNGVLCTNIRERLLDIAAGTFRIMRDDDGNAQKTHYSLADIAKKRLKINLKKGTKSWQIRFAELDGIPVRDWPPEAIEYARNDATTTWKIYQEQERQTDRSQYYLPTQYEDTRADFALRLISTWGIQTDKHRVKELWTRTISEMHEHAAILSQSGLVTYHKDQKYLWDETSPSVPEIKKKLKPIRELIEREFPGKNIPRTPKKAIQTSREVLEQCDHPLADRIIEFNKLQKAAGTYIIKMFQPIIHAGYFAIGAASDRTSSFNPNLQNQPRLPGIRECYIPRDGNIFLACDFDSQEMRTLGQSLMDICGKSRLAERYQEDRFYDPHLELAARLADMTFDEAKEIMSSSICPVEYKNQLKKLRQESKIANFGFSGGMGAKTFIKHARSWGLKIDLHRSQELREAWLNHFPEMREYFNHVQNVIGQANIGSPIVPQSGFKRGGCGYTDTANTYFQTLAAHASKDALFQVALRCYADERSYLYGSRPVLFIHDEIILETPREAGADAANELEEVLRTSMERWTKDVPAAASSTLMNRWSKKAERVFDKNSRLIPWEE